MKAGVQCPHRGEEGTFYLKMEIHVQYLHSPPAAELVWDCTLPMQTTCKCAWKHKPKTGGKKRLTTGRIIIDGGRKQNKKMHNTSQMKHKLSHSQKLTHDAGPSGFHAIKEDRARHTIDWTYYSGWCCGVNSRASSWVRPPEFTDYSALWCKTMAFTIEMFNMMWMF